MREEEAAAKSRTIQSDYFTAAVKSSGYISAEP